MSRRFQFMSVVPGIALVGAAILINYPLLGFSEEGSARQRSLEGRFDSLLNAQNLDVWMRRMAAAPQHVGSPHGLDNVRFMADSFRAWGYETDIEVYHVLFPTPKERVLEIVGAGAPELTLMEPELEGDETSFIREGRLPPYNAYSADGEVTSEVVYVNQGIPRDYEELDRLGISVEGKIVLARYGGSWRGIKPKVAAEHGAVGCILYSDPRDDGYFQGDVYPGGAYRMDQGTQRGSVMDMPLFPGDPLTPGIGATEDAPRLARDEAPTLLAIPVMPIGYGDAMEILRRLEGPVAPAAWRGALPLTYHMGPGPVKVHLKLTFNWDLVPAYNLIARLPGRELKDEWIIRGNHRDAWVFGAADPISGMVALMEEARAIGILARRGHRPKRTIVYAGWDAEEPGLLGSTEWAEHHAAELDTVAALYINTDGNGRGFLRAGGSHTLERFVNEVAHSVPDPQTRVSILDRLRASLRVAGNEEAGTREDIRISPLGSGSDYTPFLQHLGIASLHISFGGENGGGSYHSAFDSYDHYRRFGDPGFSYGIALAKVAGRLTLRAANADVLPVKFSGFADNVAMYVDELTAMVGSMRAATARHNSLVDDGAYVLAADPTQRNVPPSAKGAIPYLNFAPLQNAQQDLMTSAQRCDRLLQEFAKSGAKSVEINRLLLRAERRMLHSDGLPGRSWFRHHIYAPGFYTGYGVKTLPAVREAIEARDWDEAETQIVRTAEVLRGIADHLDVISGKLTE